MLYLKSTRQNKRNYASITYVQCMYKTIHCWLQGRIPGGRGAHPTRASLKIGKKSDFFCRKIVIFHTKYPKHFRASLRSAQFFMCPPPNLKSWIRPWTATTPSPSTKLFNNYCGSILDVLLSTGHFRYFEKFFVCVNSYLPWNYFNVPYSVGRCAIFTK
jgi:hypothetical protein